MSILARDAYLESKVLSADPVELVRILYEAALEAVANARRSLRQGDIAARSNEITRAQLVLTELGLSIDHERGGAVSRNLAELYDYMQRRLIQANLEQADSPLAEVARLLETLLEGWRHCDPDGAGARRPLQAPAETPAECAVQGWSA